MRVNVKDAPYNAAGDGTTNDRKVIQEAIDDVEAAGGGTVYFPAGTNAYGRSGRRTAGSQRPNYFLIRT